MIAKEMNNGFYLRIDQGEEIVKSIKNCCSTYNIRSGMISGLGSVTEAQLGLYDIEKNEYLKKEYKELLEIASMNGNISTMNGQPYLHIHAVLSDKDCKTYGGHFARGIVGATCEVVIIPFENDADRIFSDEIGLNLLNI